MRPLRFIVVADSHIRPPDDEVDVYPSNALMVRRNRRVVDLCNRIEAAFVVHLGDIVHPLPAEQAHEPAVELASEVYARLRHPIHFVPGNHDVGDKPNALVAVPPAADESYAVYEGAWGGAFRSFDSGDLHGVIIDTPALNSGSAREAAQRVWLEADLAAAAGRRIFAFTHYPPFIRDPAEGEHYDNLGEPARAWLLGLLERHRVEAVFSGHVHSFIYNHYRGTELYVAPSTGFVRPDYSELAAIAPEGEHGRNDPPKLGFLVVDVNPDGHDVRPIRTRGAIDDGVEPLPLETAVDPGWASPIGVTLRHGLASTVDFPTSGLDEFGRKTVRSDAMLPALWEARIAEVRIPVAEGATAEGAERLAHLAGRGMRFTLRSAGVPGVGDLETIASVDPDRWEIVVPPERFPHVLAAVGECRVPLAIAPMVPIGASGHHFVSCGFAPGGGALMERWLEVDRNGVFGELVFRVPWTEPVIPGVTAAGERAAGIGRRAVVNVELPRAGESRVFDDDDAVAERVAEAADAALAHPELAVFLDGFMDHDRGYYPRHGLIDRRHNPRPALYRLIERAAHT